MNSTQLKAAQKFLALYGHVQRCVMRAVPLPSHTEDIVQQVFIEFITNSHKWDLDNDLRPLLSKITFNISHKFWNEHLKTLPPMLAKVAEHLRLPHKDALRWSIDQYEQEESCDMELAALRVCLDQLPPKSRKMIQAYYFDEISRQELAEQHGIKAGSVNRTIWRIREKLRQCIQKSIHKEKIHVR